MSPVAKHLTRTEYRKLFGGSRQAIHNRIMRGTLKVVRLCIPQEVELIEVDDEIYTEAVKGK